MFRLYPETADDFLEVETLFDLAFAPGRTALSSYRLRDDVPPLSELCFTARDEYDSLAGAIRYWPVQIGAASMSALLLGPVAVHPTHQGEGLGAVLVEETLARAQDLGWTRVLLIGDEPYYRRFGFRGGLHQTFDFPKPTNPDRILGRALSPDAFDGVSGVVRPFTSKQDASLGVEDNLG